MANIKDVAKLAGVSISTVSRVVNNSAGVAKEKSDAVLRAMSDLNYQPNTFAKALVSNKSDAIGVVVGNLSEPFFGQMMHGIENVAHQYNKQLVVSAGHQNAALEREAIQSLINRRCDALIVHSKALTDYQLMELLENQPASVLINRQIPDIKDHCVYLDSRKMGRIVSDYLLTHGHTDIATIMSSEAISDSSDRQQGYQDALAAHGVIPNPKLNRSCPTTLSEAYNTTLELLDSGTPFSAIFVFSGIMSVGVMKALRERRVQVPGDISVIAVGDGTLAHYLNPVLTIGHYPIFDMATTAAELAMHLCDPKLPRPEQLTFSPNVMSGETVSKRR
ncbi:hypothetical protein ACH42_09090 [Endozoicomonas sp. (ex Bugula neritina AB1)]|nr:hypothetical protein ACH42_09090 [Endozoicomonas sp. (ex Bugula neritina AB1)]